MSLKPIKNHIIFQFVDKVDAKGQFIETTNWGFEIRGHFDNSAKAPRWANVIAVGPECKEVKVGQQILIHALKWTLGFKYQGDRFWRTDETQVAIVRDDAEDEHLDPLGDVLVFRRHDDLVNEGKHGLQVVGNAVVDTPKGFVLLIGPKVEQELLRSTIYYSEDNFFTKFKHRGEDLWYIQEPIVLAYEAE